MHRRTIKSFAALASVAVAIGGTGGAASAAISHHAVRTGGKPVTATTLSAGRSAAKIKGSAPGGGQELNNLCQHYAGLIDEALDGQTSATYRGDEQAASEWHDLAVEIVNGGKSQGCQFAFSA
jgi:hypothetical protein